MQYRDRNALAAAACAAAFVGVAYLAKRELRRWRLLHSHMAQVQAASVQTCVTIVFPEHSSLSCDPQGLDWNNMTEIIEVYCALTTAHARCCASEGMCLHPSSPLLTHLSCLQYRSSLLLPEDRLLKIRDDFIKEVRTSEASPSFKLLAIVQ